MDRIDTRMKVHSISERFKDDEFEITILETSDSREYIETREEWWISHFDSYHNGLNLTQGGKGFGHENPNFTTFGFTFPEDSRQKMSKSAKERAKREGFEIRSERSKKNWECPKYRKAQEGKRAGKRLRPTKISDEEVARIREKFLIEQSHLIEEVKQENERRHNINSSWKKTNLACWFASKYKDEYGVSDVWLRNVVQNKIRVRPLPEVFKK